MSTKLRRRPAFQAVRVHLEKELKLKNKSINGRFLTKKRQLVLAVETWIKRMIWLISTGLGIPFVPSHQEIVNTGKKLSRDFIHDYLRKEGLLCQDRVNIPPVMDTSRHLKRIGNQLIKCYPSLYKDVSKQLNIKLTTDTSLDVIFLPIMGELFKSGITWSKIVAMFCIAATLSQECLRYGNGLAINEMVQILTKFIDNNLANWIAQHGGWVDLHRHFRNSRNITWIIIVASLALFFFMTMIMCCGFH